MENTGCWPTNRPSKERGSGRESCAGAVAADVIGVGAAVDGVAHIAGNDRVRACGPSVVAAGAVDSGAFDTVDTSTVGAGVVGASSVDTARTEAGAGDSCVAGAC